MNNNTGVIVLVTKHHIGSLIFVNYLLKHGVHIKAIIQSDTIFAKNNNIRNYIKRMKTMGAGILAQLFLVSLYMQIRMTASIALSLLGCKQKLLTLGQITKKYNIPLIRTKDINSAKTYAELKSLEPDIIVSSFFNQILRKKIFDIPKLNCVNIHAGLSQKYRGLTSYFWVLANNESESGVTIHEIDEGIDTGKIIAQKTVGIEKSDTAIGFFIKLSQECAELFLDSLDKIEKRKSGPNNTSRSHYYSMPTKEAYREFMKTGRKFFTLSDIEVLF